MKKAGYALVQTAYAGDDAPAYSLGNTPDNTLLFTFHYTPPYDQFEQLKELQLEEKSKNPFGRSYTLAIDLTEWLCHEHEEYFDIICKYLADMKNRWEYIFMVADKNEAAIKQLHIRLRTYMCGQLHLDGCRMDKDGMVKTILETSDYDIAAAEILAEILLRPEYEPYRTRSFIKQITEEILDGDAGRVTIEALKKYSTDADSLINLLSGGEISIFKEDTFVTK